MAHQVFVSPLLSNKASRCLTVDLQRDTVEDLKRKIILDAFKTVPQSHDEILRNLSIYCKGAALKKKESVLQDAYVQHGDTIRICYPVKGGLPITLKIQTQFGRHYTVETDTIRNVSDILDKIAEENPLMVKKKVQATLILKKAGTVLDPFRKIIFYDVKSGDVVILQLPPLCWFTKAFRSNIKEKKNLLEDPKIAQLVKERKEKELQNAENQSSTTDQHWQATPFNSHPTIKE